MIVSFECMVTDKLKMALDNYLHPKNIFLQMTDQFFVENKVYYFGNMVLIVENGFFDLIAQYIAYLGIIGFLFAWLSGNLNTWGSILFISLVLITASALYQSSKIRFYLLRWRIHKVVNKRLKMEWLSKEQVVSRFIHGVYQDGTR